LDDPKREDVLMKVWLRKEAAGVILLLDEKNVAPDQAEVFAGLCAMAGGIKNALIKRARGIVWRVHFALFIFQ